MKKLLILLALVTSIYAQGGFIKDYEDFESAVIAFSEHVEEYKTNIYFYQDEKAFHVAYDPSSQTEISYSFLQIFNDKVFEKVLTAYRQIEDKRELYIKKFNQQYFLRLRNKDIKHTNEMFLLLKQKYPNMYHSKAIKKAKVKKIKKDIKYEIVYLKDKYEKINSNTNTQIVVSKRETDVLPSLENNLSIKHQDINRKGGLDTLADIEHSVSNFALIRGDTLGLKNAGLAGLEPFNNYGILCSPSESVLFLVSHEEVTSIYDLRGKMLSIGSISDMAQVYLQKVAKEAGVIQDIGFKSYSVDTSMRLLKNRKIDAFFLFAPLSYLEKFLEKGFYISSIPKDFVSGLSTKRGLKRFKYKVNNRLISSFKAPDFLVSPLQSVDVDLVDKIGVVAEAYGCLDNVKIPNAFYGQLHPVLLEALAKKKAKSLESVLPVTPKKDVIEISLYKKEKGKREVIYLYKVQNNGLHDANISFDHYETKALDRQTVKPHHLLKLNAKNRNITVDKNSSRLISFSYENPFTLRVKNLPIDLVFKNEQVEENYIYVKTVVGEE